MGAEAIVALAGLVFPPVVDFVKKKFLKREDDTTEATISALATTKPETIPAYLDATVALIKAKIDWFNRDVIGQPSTWIVDLRAAIRPISVVLSIIIIAVDHLAKLQLTEGTRAALLGNVASWFGDRLLRG